MKFPTIKYKRSFFYNLYKIQIYQVNKIQIKYTLKFLVFVVNKYAQKQNKKLKYAKQNVIYSYFYIIEVE